MLADGHTTCSRTDVGQKGEGKKTKPSLSRIAREEIFLCVLIETIEKQVP